MLKVARLIPALSARDNSVKDLSNIPNTSISTHPSTEPALNHMYEFDHSYIDIITTRLCAQPLLEYAFYALSQALHPKNCSTHEQVRSHISRTTAYTCSRRNMTSGTSFVNNILLLSLPQ